MMKASIAIVLTLSLGTSASNPQSLSKLPLAAQEHIRQLMNELSPDSDLRRELLSGAHGDGAPKPWMADMRHASEVPPFAVPVLSVSSRLFFGFERG